MAPQAKKILIVEDEKPMAQALRLKLEHAGLAAEAVFDGEAALELLKKETFDLIVLDLVMPKVDGFKVLTELKARNNITPVVVISNLGQVEDFKKAKELGAQEYFVKSNTAIADIVKHIKKTIG